MTAMLKSLLVSLLTTILALIVAELAFRAVSGKQIFALAQYRTANVVQIDFVNVVSYDPQLGWRLKAGVRQGAFNTIESGARRSSATDDHLRQGGILVSGASFTAGSEVKDEDAWPAQLEALSGQPVVNGAVGNYGLDQIILRAEELLPVVRPKTLVVDIVPSNIAIVGHSYNAYPKPYFVVQNGQLVLRNVPVPTLEAQRDVLDPLKSILSYSLIIDRIMATYFPDAWYSSRTKVFTRANNDEVSVSCALLQRLKKETDEAGIRLLVTMQHGGASIESGNGIDGNTRLVEECINKIGIQLLDEFVSLKALHQKHPDEFRSLYMPHPGGVLGHKSPAGNRKVAEMVAAALASPASADVAPEAASDHALDEPQQQARQVMVDTDNVASIFPTSPIAAVDVDNSWWSKRGYRMLGAAPFGEHYLVAPIQGTGGTLTFSVEARAGSTSHLRLQILRAYPEEEVDGAIASFDLGRKTTEIFRLGVGRNIGADLQPMDSGWYRLSVTVAVPLKEGSNRIVLQIGDANGNYQFGPDADAINIRHVMLIRGESHSPDRAGSVNAN